MHFTLFLQSKESILNVPEHTSKTRLLKEAKIISSADRLDMYLTPAKWHKQQLSSVTIEFFGLKGTELLKFIRTKAAKN